MGTAPVPQAEHMTATDHKREITSPPTYRMQGERMGSEWGVNDPTKRPIRGLMGSAR